MRPRYRLDLTGRVFGRLTAVESVMVGRDRGWRCTCSCGNEHRATTTNLLAGNVTSCGCYRREASPARARARARQRRAA